MKNKFRELSIDDKLYITDPFTYNSAGEHVIYECYVDTLKRGSVFGSFINIIVMIPYRQREKITFNSIAMDSDTTMDMDKKYILSFTKAGINESLKPYKERTEKNHFKKLQRIFGKKC